MQTKKRYISSLNLSITAKTKELDLVRKLMNRGEEIIPIAQIARFAIATAAQVARSKGYRDESTDQDAFNNIVPGMSPYAIYRNKAKIKKAVEADSNDGIVDAPAVGRPMDEEHGHEYDEALAKEIIVQPIPIIPEEVPVKKALGEEEIKLFLQSRLKVIESALNTGNIQSLRDAMNEITKETGLNISEIEKKFGCRPGKLAAKMNASPLDTLPDAGQG